MLKKIVCFVFLIISFWSSAQEKETLYHTKKILPAKDTIKIDSVSINKEFFKLQDKLGKEIDTSFYKIDFQKSQLVFKNNYQIQDSITIRYLKFPKFLTREYSLYDSKRVVPNGNLYGSLYKTDSFDKKFTPFEGLNTAGSISRGISIGNNQNTSSISNLDLQITGKLSDKVSVRASIQDNNIPLQSGGYSQKLDEFDQVFVELFSDRWSVRGGDLFLENRKSRFLNFNKKVQGVAVGLKLGDKERKTDIYASGGVVRGQYAKSTFVGQEGNQGPYKLKGNNGELYVLVISGSERVYVNGILLKRGENNDYVIDYNAGEITFTSLFPINSEMRIIVEYQYSDRNFTRFVTYGGAHHESTKWSLGGYVYSENDVKNQPLQQNLSQEQVQILANAGDNLNLMNAISAVADTYSANKILYKKSSVGGAEVFVFSNNANDVLYNVKFSFVGNNKGNYKVANANANGKIFEYVAPIAGIPQGSYEPIIRLIAPTKIQVATVMGKLNPSEKTNVDFEVGISNNDKNLYSNLDDNDNQGLAGKINFKQRLFTKKWKVDVFGNYQLIQKGFTPIERLFSIEFNRDWNLVSPSGNQSLLINGLEFALNTKSVWKYQFENLNFSESFNGNRQFISGFYRDKNWDFSNESSYMVSSGSTTSSKFLRTNNALKYKFSKNYVGGSFRHESNQEQNKTTQLFSNLTQKFTEYGTFAGRGDSTKVFVEVGYLKRVNDSLQNGILKRVNTSDSYFLKSKLIQNEKTDLALFVNYRNLKFEDKRGNEPSLNSRVIYNDRFFKDLIQINTVYETTSGTIAQQEFGFVEVEPGKGIFAWNDYNHNGIQEIQEFEIAQFPDQAKYIKVFLPNQIFIKTNKNKFSQALTLSPTNWQNKTGFLKVLSHFYNQSNYLVERKIIRDGDNFDLNPFSASNDNLLGINANFRNNLFYNRGKQKHSVTYSFATNRLKSLLSSGAQEAKTTSNQLQYIHLLQKSWLFNSVFQNQISKSYSENYSSRNFDINTNAFEQKISYLFNKNVNLELFYNFKQKSNSLGEMEFLKQNKAGMGFNFLSEKQFTSTAEFSYINNNFFGNEFSPVGFQMMEGLQAGKNLVWKILLQKKLTQYLDININYQGRKSDGTNTIHNGTIQLRAYF